MGIKEMQWREEICFALEQQERSEKISPHTSKDKAVPKSVPELCVC